MGSWGVKAHESDTGLDLLAVADERYLCGMKYKTFYIKHIIEILRSHIIDKFAKESFGWDAEYIEFFYDYTFPHEFAHAVVLVAECFVEYQCDGEYIIHDFEEDKDRGISEFIFTDKDLKDLLSELQSILEPEHRLYKAWEGGDSFNEWKSHIQMLCDSLSQAINEGGESS